MPTPKRGPRFGGDAAHQKAIISNLAQELFWDEKVTTTVAKARMLRPYAEKMITRARTGTLHARRLILKDIEDTEVVTKLFDEVAPRYKERPGGYTRIVRIGPRRGSRLSVRSLWRVPASSKNARPSTCTCTSRIPITSAQSETVSASSISRRRVRRSRGFAPSA